MAAKKRRSFRYVAHEMAHQWWAHQVISANVQGATMVTETLAEYSALMVMEREYGKDNTTPVTVGADPGVMGDRAASAMGSSG